jgi:hypothetical protein
LTFVQLRIAQYGSTPIQAYGVPKYRHFNALFYCFMAVGALTEYKYYRNGVQYFYVLQLYCTKRGMVAAWWFGCSASVL